MTTAHLSTDPTTVAREVLLRLQTAWNDGDGTAFGALYTPDASFVNIRGEHIVGREAIGAGHSGIFSTIYAGSVNSMDLVRATAVGDGAVLAVSLNTLDCPPAQWPERTRPCRPAWSSPTMQAPGTSSRATTPSSRSELACAGVKETPTTLRRTRSHRTTRDRECKQAAAQVKASTGPSTPVPANLPHRHCVGQASTGSWIWRRCALAMSSVNVAVSNQVGNALASRLGPRKRAWPLASRSRNGTRPRASGASARCRPRGRDRREGPDRPCRR